MDLLEARYDGRIPAAEREAAAAAMKTWTPPAARRAAPPRPATPAEISRVLIDRTSAAGACTEADLLAAGFSPAELTQHLEAARRMARQARLEA
jgi:hypothetical protein